MLKFMRDSSQSILIYFMFGILVVVFAINFGPGSGSCGGTTIDYAAMVNGEIIRRQEYGLAFKRLQEQQRQRMAFGGRALDARLEGELRHQVIDELINQRLLAQEAANLGLTTSDEELLEYLNRSFGVDQVDFQQYERWINNQFQTTVSKFEQKVREDVIADRLRRGLEDNITIGDAELRQTYLREHDRAMVTMVRFDPHRAEIDDPSDADIDALLADEMEAVKARFEKDIALYRTPKQVRARQILKRLPLDAGDAEVAKVRGALLEIKGQLDGGADFAALAKSASDDEASRDQGGDLGFLKRGQMGREIMDALFALKSDEITAEPVRSPLGLHLMQVTEITPPARKELTEVQREVASSVLIERRRDESAKKNAEAFLARLQAGESIEALTWSREEDDEKRKTARESGKTLKGALPVRMDSPWMLASQEALAGIGLNAELKAAIFSRTPDEPLVDRVHKVARHYYVVNLKERETPDLAKFEEEKESLRERLVWTKRTEVVKAWLKHLRGRAVIKLNPEVFPSLPNGA